MAGPAVEPASGGSPRHPGRRWLIVVMVAALGLIGTGLAASALRRVDEERLSHALDQRTAMVAQTLKAEMDRYSTSLLDLGAAVGAQGRLERQEFDAITAATDRQRLPGATSVG